MLLLLSRIYLLLIFLAIALFGYAVECAATGVRTSDITHDKRDEQQDNHAVGCDGKSLAVLAIDIGEDESPYSRETADDEEHQSLCSCAELGGEQFRPPQRIENLNRTAVVDAPEDGKHPDSSNRGNPASDDEDPGRKCGGESEHIEEAVGHFIDKK